MYQFDTFLGSIYSSSTNLKDKSFGLPFFILFLFLINRCFSYLICTHTSWTLIYVSTIVDPMKLSWQKASNVSSSHRSRYVILVPLFVVLTLLFGWAENMCSLLPNTLSKTYFEVSKYIVPFNKLASDRFW